VAAEAPEEVVETRSLYEQLQAQKEAKQLEYDEQHRLSVYSVNQSIFQFNVYKRSIMPQICNVGSCQEAKCLFYADVEVNFEVFL